MQRDHRGVPLLVLADSPGLNGLVGISDPLLWFVQSSRVTTDELCVLVLVLVLYLCVLEVVSPQRSDLVLTTDVPNCETDVLILDCLHVKT